MAIPLLETERHTARVGPHRLSRTCLTERADASGSWRARIRETSGLAQSLSAISAPVTSGRVASVGPWLPQVTDEHTRSPAPRPLPYSVPVCSCLSRGSVAIVDAPSRRRLFMLESAGDGFDQQ